MIKKIFFPITLVLLVSALYSGCSNDSDDIDTAPPEVTLQSPERGAGDIPVNSPVTAAFNKAVTGINGSTTSFTLQKVGSFGTIPAAVSYDDTTFTATLDPLNDLEDDSVYVATLNNEIKSRNGIELVPVSWTFITSSVGDTTPPEIISKTPDADTRYILPETKITVEFSEALQSTSLISQNFYLMKGSVKIPATISCTGTTVTLSPDKTLEDWTDYTVTITDGIKDIAGNPVNPVIWTFTTDDRNVPVITSRIPDAGETSVPTNTEITVVFSESVKSYTIHNTVTNFILKKDFGDFGKISALVIYNDDTKTATLRPEVALEMNQTYRVFLSGSIKDRANNAMDSVEWTFTTSNSPDTTSPLITSRNPENNNTGIATTQPVTAVFNENVKYINDTNFTLEKSSGGSPVAAVVTYNTSTRTATLTPSVYLDEGTEYKVTMTGGIEDVSGNALAESVWRFVTRDDTRPVVLSRTPEAVGGVGVNTSIIVEFSEAILASTVTVFTFRVEQDGSAVSGSVSYDALSKTATFRPDAELQFNTQYTVTLANGITDLYNNKLNTMSWSFTTGYEADTTSPVVLSQYPPQPVSIDQPTEDISPNTNITVTFSEPVSGVTASNVVLKLGVMVIPAQINYDSLTNTATLLPDSALLNNTTYTVVVGETAGIRDAAGNAYVYAPTPTWRWNFTTAPDRTNPVVINKTPAPGMPDIPGNVLEVTALFSENVSGVYSDTSNASNPLNTVRLRRNSDSTYVACSVVYTANIATNTYKAVMTPVSAITVTGDYTVELTTGIADTTGNTLTVPTGWTFTIIAIDDIPPEIMTASPDRSGTAKWSSKRVQVIFSEDVKNVSATSFYVTPKSSPDNHLSSVVTYSKGLLTGELVTDAVLQYNTIYTAHLTSAITDRAGLPLTSTELTWDFITDPDTDSPTVEDMSPGNGTPGVPVSILITATFSEAIQYWDSSSFYLDPPAAASVTYDPDTKTLTLDPDADLTGNTVYTVHLTNAIADMATTHNHLANITWQFTTVPVADIINPSVVSVTATTSAVDQSTNVSVRFSEDVVNSTSKITLSGAGSTVGANIKYSKDGGNYIATVIPSEILKELTTYTVTVRGGSTGIKDTSGRNMDSDYVSTFTTPEDETNPVIVSRYPAPDREGIPLKPTVTITFSEPVTGVSSSSITLSGGVTCYVLYDEATRTATLTPNSNLSNLTTYTVTLNPEESQTIRDGANNLLAATSWSFTTTSLPVIVSTVPAMNAGSISTDLSSITLNFNQPMNPLKSWVEITDATSSYPPVSPGAVTWSNGNATATIALVGKLRPVRYTVKLYGWGGTFEDLAGVTVYNELEDITEYPNANTLDRNSYISSGRLVFDAGSDGTAPVIVSAIPAEGDINVGRNIPRVVFRFSEPMNPGYGAAVIYNSSGNYTLTNMVWSEGNRTVSFDITNRTTPALLPMTASTSYWVVPSGFRDIAGNNFSTASYYNTGSHTNGIDFTTGADTTVTEMLLNGSYPGESFENFTSPYFNLFRNVSSDNVAPPVNQTPQYKAPVAYSWLRTTCLLAYPNNTLTTPNGVYISKASDFLWKFGDYADIELVNPVSLAPGYTYILSFKMLHERLYNRTDHIEVYVSTDGGDHYSRINAGSLVSVIDSVYRYDYSISNNNPAWQTHYFDLSDYTGTVKLIFRGISAGDTGGNIFIDDVRITKY